jgi:cellobiose phosphorylase
VWLNPQVWAILAGIVDEATREQLYRVIDEYLETDYGSKTLHPAYTAPDDGVGRVSAMRPGIWENGTPYCHSNGFKIIADCLGGRGDAAWRSFRKALPDSEWNPSTHSGCEPYAMTNMYLGPENPRAGQTQFAWMTGTAGWYYRAMVEWMLGVRADWDGLRIDPCLPTDWPEARVERTFRGARYRVTIRNPDGLCKGTVRLTVDGQGIAGQIVPAFDDGGEHEIDALLT